MTYLTPGGARPSRATVSRDLGFKVPARFTEFVCQIYDFANGNPTACCESFEVALGLYPAGADARYSSTPPELFPIGKTGVDGDHHGFILHAPELDLDELPFGNYCPMDSDGVGHVGSTTERGIASIMATLLSYDWVPPSEKERLVDIAKECNIRPELEEHPAISVPSGWRFVPSADGVGTLAPADLFSPEPVTAFDQYGPATPFIEAADQAVKSGYFATALHYLRDALWFNSHAHPFDIARLMIEVYERLNRGQLAEQVNETMTRWSEMNAMAPYHKDNKRSDG
jgi:hypothetical protein